MDERDKLPGALPACAKEATVMSMNATVDVRPQKLRTLRPFFTAARLIPSTLKPEAQIVLQALLACFEKQRTVKEGTLEDLVFGFEAGKIPAACTVVGMKALVAAGYVTLIAPDNAPVNLRDRGALKAWVRYERPLLDLVYDG